MHYRIRIELSSHGMTTGEPKPVRGAMGGSTDLAAKPTRGMHCCSKAITDPRLAFSP
jgi:hypothetical protein